ncbi:hypothetical protein Poli38472_005880 [Pythium oligandrum]|uniref:Methyltransferase domain-containing protein n=1 Tax=Pythium oligandrum TaxID=41045 RepID=A0A8K1CTD3_PYTOL|nr:hypothetical protein Poli38472_005880 [Pythium oligandrum]|eukprot:TMW68412.1 hypothetical protein Poli38472_005880 [Pythium oligandrum]
MLAPRKTLHSTPLRVFRKALEIVHVQPKDVLYDVGCGDGRCVIEAAVRYGIRAVGIEIDKDRVTQARLAAQEAGVEHLVTIHHGNALDYSLDEASVVFLFLIERGLRLIQPKFESRTQPCRVVTYLYKFPEAPYRKRQLIPAKDTTDDVAFPIFLYQFPSRDRLTDEETQNSEVDSPRSDRTA